MSSPSQLSGTRPVWPTSLKIVAAAVVGSLMTAVAMVQWVPDELQTTANAGSGSPTAARPAHRRVGQSRNVTGHRGDARR